MDTLLKNKRYRNSLIAIAVIIIAVIGWLFFTNQKTYPLGDKLEYVGKQDYGCWLVCDSNPASTYYYATDMTMDEVAKYFSKTTLVNEPSTVDGETYFGVKTPSSETIHMYYYADKNNTSEIGRLKTTNKSHILTIPSFKYNIAQQSL